MYIHSIRDEYIRTHGTSLMKKRARQRANTELEHVPIQSDSEDPYREKNRIEAKTKQINREIVCEKWWLWCCSAYGPFSGDESGAGESERDSTHKIREGAITFLILLALRAVVCAMRVLPSCISVPYPICVLSPFIASHLASPCFILVSVVLCSALF